MSFYPDEVSTVMGKGGALELFKKPGIWA